MPGPGLFHDVRTETQLSVMPQLVARACMLELAQEDLEEHIQVKLNENPALELMRSVDFDRRASLPVMGEVSPEEMCARMPAPLTFREELNWQARATYGGEELAQVEYLIQCLDERGYLTTPCFEIADTLGCPVSDVEQALVHLQELDPPGVGARDLPECIRLQVLAMPVSQVPTGLLEYLETEFAHLVEVRNTRALRNGNTQKHRDFLSFIRENLHPYPADLYRPPWAACTDLPPARTPDAIIENKNNRLAVIVPLSERLALRVDSAYEDMVRQMSNRGIDDDHFAVRQMVAEARSLISNLTHRHEVIAQVAAAVVSAQEDYLTEGPMALKPLTKKEVAVLTKLHESTVCRATRGKTIMLPGGETVPFDVFFEDALPAKVTLARIVHQEDPTRPFTDHELAAELTKRGFPVARRTISKYRTALDIVPASERRQAAAHQLQARLHL